MSSEIGPVYISDEKSAETRRVIDSEITKMLREAHKRVTDMLVKPSNSAIAKFGGGGGGAFLHLYCWGYDWLHHVFVLNSCQQRQEGVVFCSHKDSVLFWLSDRLSATDYE